MTSTTTTTRTTHWIPAEKLVELRKKIASLATRAAKRGLPAVSLVEVGKGMRTFRVFDELADKVVDQLVFCVEVAVEGEVPRLAGWSFVATLHHMDGATVALGANCDVPAGTAERGPDCEHCNVKRVRRDTYLLRHDDGSWKQVGKTCLANFFGDASAERLALAAEWLGEAESMARGYGGGVSRSKGWDLQAFLAQAAMLIETNGYMSGTEARERGIDGTGTKARDAMELVEQWAAFRAHPGTQPGASLEDATRALAIAPRAEEPKPAFRHVLAAIAAINYALSLEDSEADEYRRTLRMIAQVGRVDRRTAGYAASMLGCEKRDRERAERIAAKAARAAMDAKSVHVGEVGKRVEFVLIVGKIIEIETAYGTSHLHLMRDQAGNAVKWFASGKPLEEGACLRVKATVKGHEVYNGVAQTQLSRVTVIAPAAMPA